MANMVSRIWSMVSIYLFVPLYIKFLGDESYGLVSFFATLQLTMNLLEVGLSSTLKREFAAVENKNSESRKYKLLRSVEAINVVIAFIIFFICFSGSNFIAEKWLNLENLDIRLVATTISLMGTSISLQLLTNLYFGCILGMGFQIIANIYQLGFSISKSLGAILVIWLITPDIRLFYLWHIICDVIYLIILRIIVIKKLDTKKHNLKWNLKDLSNLKEIWRYAFGIMLISFVALINRQLDKTIISKHLPLAELGAYNLATTLGQIPIIISSSVAVALFTSFTKLYTMKKEDEIKNSYLRINKLVTTIVICMGVFIAVYSNELIYFWTNSEALVDMVKSTAVFVVIGTMFLGLQEIPYAFVLAHGNTKINNLVGIMFMPFTISITYICVTKFKLQGAGIAYCILMVSQTLIYITIIYKKYFNIKTALWLICDTIIPFLLCSVFALFSKFISNLLFTNQYIILIFALISGALSLVLTLLLLNRKLIVTLITKEHNH